MCAQRTAIESLECRRLLSGAVSGYSPAQIRHAYGLDQVTFGSTAGNGAGQTIAIIDPYDDPDFVSTGSAGFATSDLHLFDQQFGLPDPPSFKKVDEFGGTNYPMSDAGSANEIALDVEWAHAIAPGANILLIEASGPYNGNLDNAIEYAREQPGVSVISMSFGSDEMFSDELNNDTLFNPPAGHGGETFVAATGDLGQPGYYPAYSPKVLAVGGTTLEIDGSSNVVSETGWSASGGGISTTEPKPAYQSAVAQSATHRTIPDVSVDADQSTGYAVLNSYMVPTTVWNVGGGTSFGAPIWSGIIAVVNQGRATKNEGPLNGYSQTLPGLYSLPRSDFNDITTGNNGFSAGAGYDLVTGLGSPKCATLVPDLVNYSASGQISGSVFHDDSGDGSQQNEEPGFSGAKVYIDTNKNGVFDAGEPSTVTDTWGSFEFNGLSPGSYLLRTATPDGYSATGMGANQSTTMNTGANVESVDFGFIRSGTGMVTGKAFNDLNGNGLLDAGEMALSGVRIFLDVNENGMWDAFEQSTITDGNGVYSFTGLGVSFEYRPVAVMPAGYQQTSTELGARLTDGETTDIDFGLSTRSFVSGNVIGDTNGNGNWDSAENGLSGWTVYADLNNNGRLDAGEPFDTTGLIGDWQIGGLNPGTYTFREVLQPGYVLTTPAEGLFTITFSTMTFFNSKIFGDQTSEVQFGSIGGTVFNDANGDDVQDNSEQGVSGVTIYNDANNNGKLDTGEMTTTTDAAGGYAFNGLTAGNYKIRQILPSGVKQTTPANGFGWTLTLGEGQPSAGNNFGEQGGVSPPPPAGGSISGTVFNDGNGNAIRDSGELGIVGIEIYNDANNNGKMDSGEASTMTDANGNYVFTGLSGGNYKIRQILPANEKQTTPANNFGWTLTLAANQSLVGKDFGEQGSVAPPPTTGGSILGNVFNDLNGNGTGNSGEVGIAGITIYNDANNNGKMDSGEVFTATDANGNYTLRNLAAGNFKIREIVPAGWKQTTPANNFGWTLTLVKNQSLTGKSFGEQAVAAPPPPTIGGSIGGSVFNDANKNGKRDSGEAWLSAWSLYIDLNNDGLEDNGETAVQTLADGSYSFAGLKAGTYIVRAIRPVGWNQTTPTNGFGQHVTVAANQSETGVMFGEHAGA